MRFLKVPMAKNAGNPGNFVLFSLSLRVAGLPVNDPVINSILTY